MPTKKQMTYTTGGENLWVAPSYLAAAWRHVACWTKKGDNARHAEGDERIDLDAGYGENHGSPKASRDGGAG